jgi:hypothetical protein
MQTISARLSDKKFDFDEEQLLRYEEKQEVETFRFIDWKNLSAESVTLPIDKVVVELIKEKY